MTSISLLLDLPISEAGEIPTPHKLHLDLSVPFTYTGDTQPEETPWIKVRIQQPPWLNRAATSRLVEQTSTGEDVLAIIDDIRQAASQLLSQPPQTSTDDADTQITEPLTRVWFYFPSISTRSKRDDFITYAPSYKLTGFLYAGKPGLLCVEGGSQGIDDYMKFIKTESWGDIPAHHKKVSERYREKCSERVFAEMTEITDLVGERRGQRVNRGDMKALEEWLIVRGLGEAFAKVLM
ncbi:hypothetical protein IQ07DRAFT_591519 [Pyrenochaeta sp. DS3sAY3a]|nr:hypothetical protein IQ07DRAFT_591519 [Pyrenochaeta sp. DS3sAY3a]